ncbi:putative phospholipid-transporting ATPase IF, partial [Cichlidogyrus casuarinus]
MLAYLNDFCIRIGWRRPPFPDQRIIPLGPISKASFVCKPYSLVELYDKNESITHAYTWYNFLPKNLFNQAQRVANFYFIALIILNLFSELSPVSPYASIMPFLFVVSLSAFKAGYEDYKRKCADNAINNVPVQVVDLMGNLKTIKSMEITVGDIVFCRANDTFPCDMLLLSSSEESGECFVTTASLDGETNLKQFRSITVTSDLESPESFRKLAGKIVCEQPISDFYKFNGQIYIEYDSMDNVNEMKTYKHILPLSKDNLLLRGARLRNTTYVYGCAIYTGLDTKMSKNSQEKRQKFSRVEDTLNLVLIFIIGLLFILSMSYTIASFAVRASIVNHWYIFVPNETPWRNVDQFFGAVILFNYLIPISLYVTVEFIKAFSTILFRLDAELYDERIDQPAIANTSDVVEEMGQIEYIFSDKTGTLTENCMNFRCFAVASGSYKTHGNKIFFDRPPKIKSSESLETILPDDSMSDEGQEETADLSSDRLALFLHLSLCHTVRVELPAPGEDHLGDDIDLKEASIRSRRGSVTKLTPKRKFSSLRRASAADSASKVFRRLSSRSPTNEKMANIDYDYQASSPDEKAFVVACKKLGVVYHGTDHKGIHIITIGGREAVRYRSLDVLEFDSDRKCMSVILQPAPTKYDSVGSSYCVPSLPVIVLCKGAETSILNKLSKSARRVQAEEIYDDQLVQAIFGRQSKHPTRDYVERKVSHFAEQGLRTLVMAARLLSSDEWQQLQTKLNMARGSLKNREQVLSAAYLQIESELTLLGCTGIEDQLQDGVAETITNLRKAGINFWILTGDKEETAVNISYSAGHFYREMKEVRITNVKDIKNCAKVLQNALDLMEKENSAEFGVVIDGGALGFCLKVALRHMLLALVTKATTVLCCRLTPLQKAEVVRLIKYSRKHDPPVTAAIGDGANDVSMIMEAHVGFGLFGKEGQQAVQAADFAFGRFRFLQRVILVHGHMIYNRITTTMKYFFYKNTVFTLCSVLYGSFCQYSTQTFFTQGYLAAYNVSMTSLPIMIFGIFEKHRSATALQDFPHLYRSISRNAGLRIVDIVCWLILGIWHAIIIFFGCYSLTLKGNESEAISQIFGFGTVVVCCVFTIVTTKLILIARYQNILFHLFILITIFLNAIIFIIVDRVHFPFTFLSPQEFFGVWTQLFTTPSAGLTYFGILIICFVALLPDFILRVYRDQSWTLNLSELIASRQKELAHIRLLKKLKSKTKILKLKSHRKKTAKNVQETIQEEEPSTDQSKIM